MLNEQLQKQIEQEAINGTNRLSNSSDYYIGFNKGYETGYEAAGEIYASKWQEEKELRERYEKALREIQAKAKQGIFPHLPVETMGAQMCIEIDRHITELFTSNQPTGSTDKIAQAVINNLEYLEKLKDGTEL